MRPLWLLLITGVVAFATASPVRPQTITVIQPKITIEEFYAFPHEGSANKLSPAYSFPEVKSIDVLLRFEVIGVPQERFASAFVAMSSDGKTIAKQKTKFKAQSGRYEIIIPGVLELSKIYGEHDVTVSLELSVSGIDKARAASSFKAKGRNLPKVEILEFWLSPEDAAQYYGFSPGDALECELVFRITGAENAESSIRVVGVMNEERGLSIDPREHYQRHDLYWDQTRGPRNDGTYLLNFYAYLPRYFYQPSYSHHDFTIYVVFEAAGQTVRLVGIQDTLVDYRSGRHRYAEDELMRVMQISRAETWRLRALRSYKPQDGGRRWFDES